MDKDRLPLPVQAIVGTFVPGLFMAGFWVARALVSLWEPEPQTDRNVILLLLAAVLVVTGFVQYRFVGRASASGMMDSAASPAALTALTLAGVALTVVVEPYLGADSQRSTLWPNRNAMPFNRFVLLVIVWLSACGGLMVRRRA